MAKKPAVVEDDEDEELEERPARTKLITIARTINIKDAPKGRAPGARNPEYERLVARLIKLAPREKAVVIPIALKADKVKIREGVRKPLRVRGFDLTAATDYDDELGEILVLYATKREKEDVEDVEDEDDETERPVRGKSAGRRKRAPVDTDDDDE